jgi:hypothetical protein
VADFRDTPESDKSLGFGTNLLLYAACCVAALLAWPIIKGAFPDSFPQENRSEPRYDAYGYTGDPGRFDRWRGADRSGPREYSPFFPGPRTQQPQGPAPATRWPAPVAASRKATTPLLPDPSARTPETSGSARNPGPQYEQQGQYRQQFRECGGAWWNPFSEAGCGAWQDAPPPRTGGR